ncbi:hypothetical protein [Sphaerisporangium perillae]|uniref:hypothetical protein n=1 Tax=Sphaerisporangium perillae TaxID=2935860 RepID=UPI00201028A8|nr:hypothetical protein [Sphaerisporangium perillae]
MNTRTDWWFSGVAIVFIVAVWFADGSELLQRDAERKGRAYKQPHTLFTRPQGSHLIATIDDLRVGDWVCPEAEYVKATKRIRERREWLKSLHDEKLKEREAREADEDIRFKQELDEWTQRAEGSDNRYPGSAPRRRHFDPIYEPDLPELPEPNFFPIIVLDYKGSSPEVDIWCMGRDPFSLTAEDRVLRLELDSHARAPKEVSEFAGVVTDLLLFAPTTWDEEANLVETLRKRGHNDELIQHAIRASLATGFLAHDSRRGRTHLDVVPKVRSFLGSSSRSSKGRRLSLNTLGEAWARTHLYPAKPETQIKRGGSVTNNNFVFFNSPVSGSNLGGTGDVINHAHPVDLADIVAATVALLDAERHRFSETSDPNALMNALEELRAALNEPKLPDSKVRRALAVVASIAGGLSMGVAGNFIFDAIKDVLGA